MEPEEEFLVLPDDVVKEASLCVEVFRVRGVEVDTILEAREFSLDLRGFR